MKTIFTCLAILCCFTAVSYGVTLLNEPCEGTSGWADRQDSTAVVEFQRTEFVHGGTYSMRLSGAFSERVESDPRTPVNASDALTASAWVYKAGGSRVALYINCYNGAAFTNRSPVEANTTLVSWVQLSNSVTSNVAANGASVLIYGVSNTAPNYKYVDDVILSGSTAVGDWFMY